MNPNEPLRKIERTLERPTREELLKRLQSHDPVEPRELVAEAVAAEREGGSLSSTWSGCERPPRPGINARATLETKSRLKPAPKSAAPPGAGFTRLFG